MLAVIQSTPPKEGRQARLEHISIEDFAAMLGTSKQRIIDWRDGTGHPDARNREKLAAASQGRYTADDFKGPTKAQRLDSQAKLEGEVAVMRTVSLRLIEISTVLCEQVEVLGGSIPADAVEGLAQAGRQLRPGGRRQ